MTASASTTPAPAGSPSPTTAGAIATTDPKSIPTVGATADPKATEVPFTGPASDRFGAANVAIAYHFVIQENRDGYTNETLLGLKTPRVVDFSYLDHYFTKPVLTQMHAAETSLAAGRATSADVSGLLGAAVWNLQGTNKGLVLSHPTTRNFVYGGAKTTVGANDAGQPLLVLNMSFGVQYLGTIDGKKVYFQIKHPETVRLIQTGDKAQPWKIDSYYSSNDVKGPLPDNA